MTVPSVTEPTHRFVEHGGEVEVELRAGSEDGLFAAALAALAELLGGDEDEDGEAARIEVELVDPDRALLLVDWLSELLFRAEVEQFVPRELVSIELGSDRLRAAVAGCRGSPSPLVKGVTLHDLRFEQTGGVWNGHVVLDV